MSFDGIRSTPWAVGNRLSENAAIKRYWAKPSVVRLRQSMDAVQSPTRPFAYARSTLLGFFVVALMLKLTVRGAHRRVQSDPELRELFGLPPMSAKARRDLERARGRQDVSERGFPSRSLLPIFIHKWLPAHAQQLVKLNHEAYEGAPGDTIVREGVDTSRVALDGQQLRSKRLKEEADPGAEWWGRGDEPAELQRLKMTAILVGIPLVVYGETMTPESETIHARETLIPTLKERSDRLRALAAEHGQLAHPGYKHAALCGDGHFANNETIATAYDHELYVAFEPPDFPKRVIEGTRRGKYEADGTEIEVILDSCNGGTQFCPCDRGKPADQREPMRQYAGPFGKDGYVAVECQRLGCRHQGHRIYLGYRSHDVIRAGGRRERGEIDYRRVNPLWRANKKVGAINFLGRQTIENYHDRRAELFWLTGDQKGGRQMVGNAAYRFWYRLADLFWNLVVAENLATGSVQVEELDVDETYANLLANARVVGRRKLAKTEAAKRRRERNRKKSRVGRHIPPSRPRRGPPVETPG